jgi:hypothetical protein
VIRLSPIPALACSLAALASCTDLGRSELFAHPTPIPFTLTAAEPAPDATDVTLGAPVTMTFSDLPDPDSLSRLGFALTSGDLVFTGGFRVDLVERTVRFVPSRALPPHLGMRVHLYPGLTSLDGRPLEPVAAWGFTTGTTAGGAAAPPPDHVLADVAPLFAARCAGCHAGPAAPHGLDLSSAALAAAGLLAQPSQERPELSRVAAGDSARSYLLRKLLDAPTIVGDPMPAPPDALLEHDELRLVADWIDGGARP